MTRAGHLNVSRVLTALYETAVAEAMLNLARGLKRLTWVGSIALVILCALLGFTDVNHARLWFSMGAGVLALSWLLFFTGRWVASGFKAGEGQKRSTETNGQMMTSFNRMLETIEQQAGEINNFATRLDKAYQELEATNRRLKETAFKDEVTGLYNRRFFCLRLEEELSRYRRSNDPVSVVLFDLNGFKAVTDDLGRAIGEDTLRDIAHILMKQRRPIQVASRYDADLFAVVLVETSRAAARGYADRITEDMAQATFSHRKTITARFGIAGVPDDEASTAQDLFRLADEALRSNRPARP